MKGESLNALRFRVEEVASSAPDDVVAGERVLAEVDRWIARAPGRPGWACKPGCASCCHLLVCVSEIEADTLAAHLTVALSAESLAALRERAATTAARVVGLAPGAYRRARIRCALLTEDDRCLAYAHRPVPCRVHASRSVAACDDPAAPVPLDTWLTKVGAAVQAGLGQAGELHGALARRLHA